MHDAVDGNLVGCFVTASDHAQPVIQAAYLHWFRHDRATWWKN
jgi:hypothetical protein